MMTTIIKKDRRKLSAIYGTWINEMKTNVSHLDGDLGKVGSGTDCDIGRL